MSDDKKPVRPALADPPVSPENAEFWDGTAQGRLLLRSCRQCGKRHHYPRAHCPWCRSDDLEWIEASGAGVIYSVSVMLRAKQPYALAYVALPEGVTMLTNIVDCDLDGLKIGDAVTVCFRESGSGMQIPFFTPAVGG